MGTNSKLWRRISTVEDQRPPNLEQVSREVHGADDNRSHCGGLAAESVVCPCKECRLAAVDRTRPVVGSKVAGCRGAGDEDDDGRGNSDNGIVVSGNPSPSVDIRIASPQERRDDANRLDSRRVVVHLVYRVLNGGVSLHVQIEESLGAECLGAVAEDPENGKCVKVPRVEDGLGECLVQHWRILRNGHTSNSQCLFLGGQVRRRSCGWGIGEQ